MKHLLPRIPQRIAVVTAVGLTAALFLSHEVATRDAFDASLATVGEIVDDTMPSVIDLSELRATIFEIRAETGRATRAAPAERPKVIARLESRFAILMERIRAYEKLPAFPEERHVFVELERGAAALHEAALRVAATGDDDEIDRSFSPQAQALDHVAMTLVEMNAREASHAARAIVATHEQAKAHSLEYLAPVILCVIALGVLAERSLARTERETHRLLGELDAFSARVAHDLRGPLGPIALALAMVKADAKLEDRSRRSIEIAEGSLHRAVALIDGLLAFARSGARPEPGARCDVARVASDVSATLRAVADEEGARLVVSVPDDLHVAASEVAVSSILANLARNALLYLGESVERTVTIRATVRGNEALLEVVDTGPGIPADVLGRLFRPFERGSTRAGGHGLGLTIVKRLAEAHGGSVTARSAVGSGTTFEVVLPRA